MCCHCYLSDRTVTLLLQFPLTSGSTAGVLLTPSYKQGCTNKNKHCNTQFGSLTEGPLLLCNGNQLRTTDCVPKCTLWVAQQEENTCIAGVCAVCNGDVLEL